MCVLLSKCSYEISLETYRMYRVLHKIFNRKTLKISYFCTKNIFEIINKYNKEIFKEFRDRTNNNNNYNNNNSKQNECNCKTWMNCPMNGLCNLDNVVSQGIIYPKEIVKDKKETYIGISSTKWKSRYANQWIFFLPWISEKPNSPIWTFWSLKNKGLTPKIQWSISKKSNTPKCFDSRCNLCLEEKNTNNDILRLWKISKSAMWINS